MTFEDRESACCIALEQRQSSQECRLLAQVWILLRRMEDLLPPKIGAVVLAVVLRSRLWRSAPILSVQIMVTKKRSDFLLDNIFDSSTYIMVSLSLRAFIGVWCCLEILY